MMITVFTPTYNRAYSLPTLYNSLKRQTSRNFEWLIVDDGSTDETEALVSRWLHESLFSIRYLKQENGGKHRAINRGISEAKGELFFIVDSDDYLVDEAIEIIEKTYAEVKGDDSFCGVCPLRVDKNMNKIGAEFPYNVLDCSPVDFRFKYEMIGDMAEVVRTDVLKSFLFPEIPEESFCPEALVWNRIGMKYKFRYTNDKVYVCEYLPDGLTAKITKIRMTSPIGSCMCYAEQVSMPIPFKYRLKSAINYWRFWFCPTKNKKPSIPFVWWWTLPIGLMMHIKDTRIK